MIFLLFLLDTSNKCAKLQKNSRKTPMMSKNIKMSLPLFNIYFILLFLEFIIIKLGNWHWASRIIERSNERIFLVKTPHYKKIFRRRYRSLKSNLVNYFCFPLPIIFLFTAPNNLVTLMR